MSWELILFTVLGLALVAIIYRVGRYGSKSKKRDTSNADTGGFFGLIGGADSGGSSGGSGDGGGGGAG